MINKDNCGMHHEALTRLEDLVLQLASVLLKGPFLS